MLYILTALKQEALPLEGLDGKIIVTGAGSRAIDALNKIELKSSDKVLNVGICGSLLPKGNAYAVSSVSFEGNKTLYPDVALWQELPLMPLKTVNAPETDMEDDMLYDMEGYLVASWALKVIPPSNLCIVKVVSDSGSKFPAKQEVTDLIKDKLGYIRKCAINLNAMQDKAYDLTDMELAIAELGLSFYMTEELKDLARYAKASGKEDILTGALSDIKANCRNKKQAREALDEIYMRLR